MTTGTQAAAATAPLTMETIIESLIANLNPFFRNNKVTVRSPVNGDLYKVAELREDGYFIAHHIGEGGVVEKATELLPCNPYYLGLILNQWSDFNAAAPASVVGMTDGT